MNSSPTIKPPTFQAILKSQSALLAIDSQKNQDFYYKERERFVKLLETYIREVDFSDLSGNKILKICALVSTYRPMALHSFLIRCSQLIQAS
jgi:hypothetical protein